MRIFLLLFSLLTAVYAQFKMSPFSKMTSKAYTQGLIFAAMRNDSNQIILSVKETNYKLVRWNTTSASNVSRDGEYYLAGQSTIYSYIYFFNGYIMASSNLNPPRIFNQSTYAYIGTLNVNITIGRGQYLASKGVFAFGTSVGNVGYFNVSTLPNISPVYLRNDSSGDFVFLQKSLDQAYISFSYKSTKYLNVYRTSDWSLVKNISVSVAGIYTQAWSSDNRYLMAFIYNQSYVQVFDSNNGWNISSNITIGHQGIRTSFYYEQTNVIVALSQGSQKVITVNWYDYSVQSIYSINAWKMYTGSNGKSLTCFSPTSNTSWFFNIDPYCANGTAYDIPTKNCVSNTTTNSTCSSNCAICTSSTNCTQCANYYELDNSTCYPCINGQFYNTSSMRCNSCSPNCDICSSSTTCTSCTSDTFLVNQACVTCPIGNNYNYTSNTCYPNCTDYCTACASASTCSTCNSPYQAINGTCESCNSTHYYNASTLTCNVCPTNCTLCSNSTSCSACSAGVFLVNSSCISCPTGSTYNYSAWQCEVNCTTNCLSCSTASTCSVCSNNYELLANGSCSVCGLATIFNSSTSRCDLCSASCISCTSSTICTSCDSSSILSHSVCITCSAGSIFNTTSQLCEPFCTPNCDVCLSIISCSVCANGYNLVNSSCISCQDWQVYNYQTWSCQMKCPDHCQVCDTLNICSICSNNYIIYQGACYTQDQYDYLQGKRKYNSIFQITMGLTVQNQAVADLNKFPGSRRVFRQLFAFFLNIDHLWLYIYHKRQYGYYVNRLLKAVQLLQKQKWNLVSTSVFNETLNLDMYQIALDLNDKQNYTSWKYIQIQQQSSSFLQNSLDYFFLNVPLVVVVFLVFKILFHLFFKYQISILFRQYAFNGYLLLMLIQGNCQSFTYLFVYDTMSLIQANIKQKILNFLSLILFMLFISQLISGFFIIKSAYDKHAKYFYDNCSNTLIGSTHLMIQYGILNFSLGAVHIFLQNYYNTQLLVLFLVQFLFIASIVKSIKRKDIYQYRYVQWINLFGSFLRILLIFTYFCDQDFPGQYEVVQQIQMYLIIFYLLNWIISSLIAYTLLLVELIKYVASKLKTKRVISKIKNNPYLQKYKNLAKIQKRNKNVKIQTFDQPYDQFTVYATHKNHL